MISSKISISLWHTEENGAGIWYIRNLWPSDILPNLTTEVYQQILPLIQTHIRPSVCGSIEPRDTIYQSDVVNISNLTYTSRTIIATQMTSIIKIILNFIIFILSNNCFNLPWASKLPNLNCVLINHYKNGKDSMGAHADNNKYVHFYLVS